MSNTIKLKRGSGSNPSASDLSIGEVALRTDTGQLFTKKDNNAVQEIGAESGVSDGDKGDITVSNSGSTFTIDNDAVTFDKIQNIAQGRILGRKNNGTANVEDLTTAEIRTLLNVEDGATADQTASEILTLLKTVDGGGSGLDADLLDGIGSGSFIRSDADDSFSGTIIANSDSTNPVIKVQGGGPNFIRFDSNDVSSDSIDLIYRTTPNTLAFERVSDAQIMFSVDADNQQAFFAGNLDVGAGLDVTGNITATGDTHKFTSGTSGDCKLIIEADTDNNEEKDNPIILLRQDGGIDVSAIGHNFSGDTNTGNNEFFIANSVSSGAIVFYTGGTAGYTNASERLRISSSGQIDFSGNVDCNQGLDVTGGDITGVLGSAVTGTTQSASDNSTKVATTAFVSTAINNLINGAPSALNTLNELAAAMNDNASFSTTVTNNLATKLALAGGEMTGNITFSGTQTVDGRDLSVDGSKLDGIESGATADQSASEILTLIKTVDGAGSGLNADKLDGLERSTSGNRWGVVPFVESDGVMEIGKFIDFHNTDTDTSDNIVRLESINSSTINISGNKIWHAGNMGVNSGLNADLLDGLHASSFLSSDAADVMSQSTQGTATLDVRNTGGAGSGTGTGALIATFKGDSDSIDIRNIADGDYGIYNPQQNNGFELYDGGGGVRIIFNGGISVEFDSGNAYGDFKGVPTVNGTNLARVSDNITGTSGGFTAGNASNLNSGTVPQARLSASTLLTLIKTVDGAGSGLNADTLDGINSESFVRSDANDSITGHLTITNDSGLKIYSSTSAVGAKINFSDQTSRAQNGTLTYKHQDGAITTTGGNSNDGWVFEGSETRTVVKVVGDIEATSNIYGAGANITALNASNITSGTINTARLPNTYTKASVVTIQSTGAGNDVRLDAADHIIFESGEEEDGCIFFRGNSGVDSYRFAKSGQTSIEGFLSFESISADRTFTFPNASGTISLTSDIPTNNNELTNGAGYITGLSFDNLTGKTSGTGDYSTSGDIVAGRGSGSISLTINDGRGNSNLCFNHQNGVPDQNGNAARIEVNTDSTSGATMFFEIKSNVTGGASTALTSVLDLTETRINPRIDIIPITDSSINIGSNGVRFANGYFDSLYGDGSNLTGISAGAQGGATDEVFWCNNQSVTSNFTIPNNKNAMTAGPIEIESGVTVTVGSGENWTVV